jgi:predicted RNA-binding Zn-ribbon protein involved in translation (DUF1610 family)
MTTIKATCPTCGEVGLTPEEIELRVDHAGDRSFYAFTCPACTDVVRKPADDRIIRLLSSGGVEPLRLGHDFGPRPEGPRFTHDDILDFHTLLATDGWFAQVKWMVRGARA